MPWAGWSVPMSRPAQMPQAAGKVLIQYSMCRMFRVAGDLACTTVHGARLVLRAV